MSSLIKGNKIIGKYDNRTPAKRPDKKYPKYNDDIFLNLKIKWYNTAVIIASPIRSGM